MFYLCGAPATCASCGESHEHTYLLRHVSRVKSATSSHEHMYLLKHVSRVKSATLPDPGKSHMTPKPSDQPNRFLCKKHQ